MTRAGSGGAALPARALVAAVTTRFTALPHRLAPGEQPADGPLGWPGYDAARIRAQERTGESESVVCGLGDVGGTEAVLIAFESGFLGGSIGERAGDRIESAFLTARDLGLPVVSLLATGGSRVQEGMRALVRLPRITREQERLRAAGLVHLAVLAGPVTGGGWAALGAGADVRLALPGAQIAFAGSRVRPPGADPAAYTAEGQLAAGQVDAVVSPGELRTATERWLSLLTSPARGPVEPPDAQPGPPGTDAAPATGWEAVTRARAPGRPRAAAYLAAYLAERVTLGGTDPGVRCGFGRRAAGGTVGFVAQGGTATRPAGFRAAARLLRLADRLSVPVLTLVDTPGADGGAESERDGAGAALAEVFAAVAASRIPVTTLLVGEGGSGGAMALTAPGRLWVAPGSFCSVIAPELAAAILRRGPGQVRRTADELRLRPQDLVTLGIARGIVPFARPSAGQSAD